MAQSTEMVVSISAHRVYMVIQSEMLINSYTKRFNFGESGVVEEATDIPEMMGNDCSR